MSYKLPDPDKVIYYDSEYVFLDAKKKSEWEYCRATLRTQQYRVGLSSEVVFKDVWKEGNDWDKIFALLEQGYSLAAHVLIADVRPDICPEGILKYLFNGQGIDTRYLEKLTLGMNRPTGEWTTKKARIDSEDAEEEDLDEEEVFEGFALSDLVYRHCGVKLTKSYQDARTWLAKDLPIPAIEYAKRDVLFLPQIYQNQKKLIEELELEEQAELNHKLVATSYIAHKYGIAIDTKELKKLQKEYREKAQDLESRLMQVMPKVTHTNTQLIDMWFKMFWTRGGMLGYTNNTVAKKDVKAHRGAIAPMVHKWVEQNKQKLLRKINLRAPAQRLEAFKKLGYNVEDTASATLGTYVMFNEAPAIDTFIEFQKCNSLLTKTLERLAPGVFLRPDGTVRTTYDWLGAMTGRASSNSINCMQLPKEFKSLYSVPDGMASVSFDYAAIELQYVMDKFPDSAIREMAAAKDSHCLNAARFFGKDYKELLEGKKKKDPEAILLRNASKTAVYFSIYRSCCTPEQVAKNIVPGVNKLTEVFRNQLKRDLKKEEAQKIILETERLFASWSKEKLKVDALIKKFYDGGLNTLEFRGALNMYYRFDILAHKLMQPAHTEIDPESGEPRFRDDYINGRSIYSCMVQGAIATGAKMAVKRIQEELYTKFGVEKARLVLFVHDSIQVYCLPELKEEVQEIVIRHMLESVYNVCEFTWMPVEIEGGVVGQKEEKWSYDGVEIVKK